MVFQPNIGSVRPTNKPFFPQRAPIASSEYIGIGSHSRNFSSSDRITHSSEIFRSSNDIVHSSDRFISSDDILKYLKYHPDYQKVIQHPRQIDPIVAIILSGITLGIGITLCALPWVVPGFVGGAVFSLASSLVFGAGFAGVLTGISGLRNEDFSWKDLAKNIALDSMVTLLTFGTGYGPAAIAGLALIGKNLTPKTIKVIGQVAGGLVNSAVNPGCYILKTYIKGEPVKALSFLMTIGGGAYGGQSAAGYVRYLSVEVAALQSVSSLAFGAEVISSRVGNELIQAYKYIG